MPELPDVEAFRRYLADHAVGRTIERVEVPDADVVRNTTPQGLGLALGGRSFEAADRHGKWVLARLGGPTLVLHFGMTGYLTWVGDGDEPRDDHDRVVFVTDGGELRFNLMRRFGGVWVASDEDELTDITGELGPDARGLDRDDLADLLDGRRGGLKSALMDQQLVAGIGNIVADETLWHACLHPRVAVADLDEGDLDRLHDALHEVLEVSIDHGQVPRQESWLTHARADGRGGDDVEHPDCPRCGTPIEHGEVNSRSTYWCPNCQPDPN